MRRKILIVAGMALLLLVCGITIALKVKKEPSVISPVGEQKPKPEVELTTWEDQAGFRFSYPGNIEIDPHEEDTQNYAHLELTSADHQGKIFIWVKDATYLAIDDWRKVEIGEKEQVFDTELGGKPAKKVAYLEPEKLVTAAIDVDALVLVEMFPDEAGFWQEVYDQILKSFTFIPLEGEEAVAPGAGEGLPAGGIIEEPEEVIQ